MNGRRRYGFAVTTPLALLRRTLRSPGNRGALSGRSAILLLALSLTPGASEGASAAPVTTAGAAVELHLLQPDGSPAAEAVLAAYPLETKSFPAPSPAVMDQRDRRFEPRVLPVQTGARVTFPNSDTVSHHVYSFSTAKRFQLFLGKGEPAQTQTFGRSGVVTLGCNLHDWMLGYIVVLDTPYFAVTDGAGRARVTGLPPGTYRLEVWHARFSDATSRPTREVRVEAGASETWELKLDRPLLPARDQKPGFVEY
ncbi:MAG: methylamine utilization protein [Thermoanaerobaculia bacterium]